MNVPVITLPSSFVLQNLNMQEFVEMFSLKDWEVASRKVQNLSFGQV
jgi:hypothetical protein